MTARLDLPPLAHDHAGSRHAALFLHGIAGADRAWLLDALGLDGRVAVEPLLVELDTLGVPPSPALTADLLRRHEPAAPVRSPTLPDRSPNERAPTAAERVAGVAAAALAQPLGDAPDALVVRILRYSGGRARRGVLRRYEAARRRRIEAILASDPPSHDARKLDEAALHAVLARIDAQPAGGRGTWVGRATVGIVDAWRRLARWARRSTEGGA